MDNARVLQQREMARVGMPEGSRLYFIIRHQTNNKRWLSFYNADQGLIEDVTVHIARVLDMKRSDCHGGSITVNGSGFNGGVQIAELMQEALGYKTPFVVEQLY